MDFLAFFGGFVGGIAFYAFMNWAVEKRARRLVLQAYGAKGRQAQQEQQDDLMSLLAEVKAAHDEWKAAGGTDNAQFAKSGLLPIALRHPRTVARYGKKLYDLFKTGDFENFQGLAE